MDKEYKPKSSTRLCDLNRNALRMHTDTRQDEIYVHGYCLPSDATGRLENVNRMHIATELLQPNIPLSCVLETANMLRARSCNKRVAFTGRGVCCNSARNSRSI